MFPHKIVQAVKRLIARPQPFLPPPLPDATDVRPLDLWVRTAEFRRAYEDVTSWDWTHSTNGFSVCVPSFVRVTSGRSPPELRHVLKNARQTRSINIGRAGWAQVIFKELVDGIYRLPLSLYILAAV